jgi:heat shock protein HtpX
MYEHISSNKIRSALLVFSFFIFVMLVLVVFAVAFNYYYDLGSGTFICFLILALIISLLTTITGYYNSDKIVLAISRAKPVSRDELPQLYYAVEGLSIAAGVPIPRIYLIDDSAPNAFATGRNPQNSVIAVTTGLLDKLNEQELKGVIGHELSHVRNYDIRLGTVLVVMSGIVILVSDWVLRFFWFGPRRRRSSSSAGGILAIFLILFALALAIAAPLFATLIRLAISRRREFLADADGSMITRYPPGLASALRKITADVEPLEVANKATAHLYIANPLKDQRGPLNSLFDTHPPIEERIRRLEEMSLGIK